jgi:hypothetical protein
MRMRMGNAVEHPIVFASPAWHPTWRDYVAYRLANGVMRVVASRGYRLLLEDAYLRGFRCAVEHGGAQDE